MREVEIEQVCARLSELIEEITAGGEVVLTRDGQPLARLIPVSTRKRAQRSFGSAKGLLHIAADFDEPLDDFRDYV